MFLENLQNSQENTCVCQSLFFNKVAGLSFITLKIFIEMRQMTLNNPKFGIKKSLDTLWRLLCYVSKYIYGIDRTKLEVYASFCYSIDLLSLSDFKMNLIADFNKH